MAETMKALVLEAHGDIDTLKVVNDYPKPSPGPGEVLIRVGASSFNYHDVFKAVGVVQGSLPDAALVPGPYARSKTIP